METLVRDLRYGVRVLLRNPAATLIATLALALGIGANTAIFSAVYAVLLRPLPVRDAGRLVVIVQHHPRIGIPRASAPLVLYSEWKRDAQSFESMAGASSGTAALADQEHRETVKLWRVSADFFPTLGAVPPVGRNFAAEEDAPGGPRVAILSHELWERKYGADRGILGRTIQMDDVRYTVVGVMPAGFHVDGKPADVYTPIAMSAVRGKRGIGVTIYARLKPGITIARAQSEMAALAAREKPYTEFGWRLRVWGIRDILVQDVRASMLVLLGAVALVLLIACVNVASLLLAKASARRDEIAIRVAIGAGRRQIMRQLLTESTLLSLAGGACGLVLAYGCVRLVPLIQDERLPAILGQTRIDGAVLAFTIGISLVTGLLFGAVPAFSLPETLVRTRKNTGGKRLWNALVVSETALALVLTVGATLLARTFYYLRDDAPGFRISSLFTASISPAKARYAKPEQLTMAYRQVATAVRGLPGVQSATVVSSVPLSGDNFALSAPVEGQQYTRPEQWPQFLYRKIDPDYFRTMQIPIRAGRNFTDQDRGVAIVNETLARKYFPEGALGRHLGTSGKEYWEIVAVAADVRHTDAQRDVQPELFLPYGPDPLPAMTIAVRIDPAVYRSALRAGPAIQAAIGAIDRQIQVSKMRELEQIASDRLSLKWLSATLLASFAGLAVLLAAIGTYGVLSFSISQRTHEIGVRMALGAERTAVLGMIVKQAAALAAIGIVIGAAGAVSLRRVLATVIVGVSPTDPATFAAAAAVLLAVSVTAAYVPAQRAAGVDPAVALRHE